jgi:ribosomal protein S12 methylthiotransferase
LLLHDGRKIMKPRAALMHLGCAKNLVDSETVVPQLLQAGYEITTDATKADLVVVNTCGFLESAVEEAIQTILEIAELKQTGACRCLMVIGCMVQRYGKKLLPLLPEVDVFAGTSHYQAIAEILLASQSGRNQRIWISAPRHLQTSCHPRLRSTPAHTAYLKIAEGCSNRCTFCLIPKLRGPYRSRSVADVLREASFMVGQGVREINVIAQDITAFGTDRGEPQALIALLEALENITELEWVRLLYAYPGRIHQTLLATMAQSRKIVPYLDFPIQHCVSRILSVMHRGMTFPDMEDLVAQIRAHVPGIALRTSLMVGFPGEAEEDFEALLTFVERVQFDHLGVFAYSAETGSPAARYPDQVPENVKLSRREEILAAQQHISRRRLQRLLGRVVPVLIEGFHPETDLLLCGRMPTQAPEVDGMVLISKGTGRPGEVMPVKISAVEDYDVIGELVDGASDCHPA